MNAVKLLGVVAVLVAVYFAFFASSAPREIDFRGQTLGPRERVENNSIRDFDIYSYRDRTNHNLLLLLMVKDESATAQELLEFYVSNFKAQGFEFRQRDNRYFGTKGDEVIFMTRAPQIDSAIAYIQKAPDPFPRGFRGAADVFADLESFAF